MKQKRGQQEQTQQEHRRHYHHQQSFKKRRVMWKHRGNMVVWNRLPFCFRGCPQALVLCWKLVKPLCPRNSKWQNFCALSPDPKTSLYLKNEKKKRLIELNLSIPEEKMMFWKLRTWLTFINIAPALTFPWENWLNIAWSLGVERKHEVLCCNLFKPLLSSERTTFRELTHDPKTCSWKKTSLGRSTFRENVLSKLSAEIL